MKRVAQALLLVMAIGLIALLVVAPKPWDVESLLRIEMGWGFLLRDYVALGFWCGAAFDLVIVLLLLATVDLWIGGRDPSVPDREAAPQAAPRRGTAFALLAVVGMTATGLAAYPRLSHSLWGDEDYSLRLHLLGHFKRDLQREGFEDGKPFFRKLSWRDTVFGYRTTNNHFLYTIVGRVTLEAWQKAKGVRSYVFSESVLRAPAFVAGVLAVGAWILLGFRLGIPWATVPLVLLLWCNPWFIRYITEARGYAFVFLLIPLSLVALLSALDGGRWRAWSAFGVAQFLMLYSWPGVAPHVVAVNLLVGGLLLWRARGKGGGEGRARLEQPLRWGVVNLLVLLVLLPLILPAFPQVQYYLAERQHQLPVTGHWLGHLHSLFVLGTPFYDFYLNHPDVNPLYHSVHTIARNHGPWIFFQLYGVYAFALMGLVAFVRGVRYGGLLACALLGAGVTFWFSAYLNGTYLFPWYFAYLQPFLFLLAGLGMIRTGGFLLDRLGVRGTGTGRILMVAGFVVLALTSWYFTSFRLGVMRRYSIDPLRESVAYVRGDTDPNGPGMYSTLLGHAHIGAFSYDAHGYPVDRAFSNDPLVPGVTRLMRLSDSLGIPLFFTIGFPADARGLHPDVMNLLDDEELFEPARLFWSSEPQLIREVFRYRGGFFPPMRPAPYTAPEGEDVPGWPVPAVLIPSEAERRALREEVREEL